MEIVVIGLNHRTAPVEIRERAAMNPEQVLGGIRAAVSSCGLREAFILSTCNRTEFYGVGPAGTGLDQTLLTGLCNVNGELDSLCQDYFYVHTNVDAVRHLASVAAGLDSQVIGENEILGQVREAFALANKACGVGRVLEKLRDAVLRAGRRVRAETLLCRGAVSISSAAVDLSARIFKSLEGKKVILLGAGEMAALAGRHVVRMGATDVVVANRTLERARILAEELAGQAVGLDAVAGHLPDTDLLVAAAGGDEILLTREAVWTARKTRSTRPLLLIDISVPRCLDPDIRSLEAVFLKTIDDLNSIIEHNLSSRRKEAPQAEGIVEQETARFMEWYGSQSADRFLKELAEKLEGIRREEVARTVRKSASLGEEDLDRLTRSIIDKILYHPASLLRNSTCAPEELEERLVLFKDLFGLNGRTAQDVPAPPLEQQDP